MPLHTARKARCRRGNLFGAEEAVQGEAEKSLAEFESRK